MMSPVPVVLPPRSVAGVTASMTLGLTRLKLAAGVLPKSTADTPAKWLPTILTVVPPTIGPEFGITLVMKPAAGVIGAVAITTGGGPVHTPEKDNVPSVTLRLPAGLIDTEAEVAPEAAEEYTPVEPLNENGAVAPIGNGFGNVTVPLNVAF